MSPVGRQMMVMVQLVPLAWLEDGLRVPNRAQILQSHGDDLHVVKPIARVQCERRGCGREICMGLFSDSKSSGV